MDIITLVNIISFLSLLLGGICMKKYASSPADHSIGYRTQRSMSSDNAWYAANKKCGDQWLIIGIAGFVLTIVSVLLIQPKISSSAGSIIQFILLLLQISAVIFSFVSTEAELKKKFDKK